MAHKSLAETIPVPPQSKNQDAADALNDVYNDLMNERTELLLQLDANRKAMDDISLEMAKLEEMED